MEQARHEAQVGKSMASKAAEYPEELCRAYATLVVKIFKTTLQMEKKEEVSEAQLRWLGKQGEEDSFHQSRHKSWRLLEGFWMADNVEDSSGPTEGPSKKSRRERENENYVGGMRQSNWQRREKTCAQVVDEVCG